MENQLKAELRIGNALKFWNNIFFVSEITELKITAKNKSLGIICEDYIEFSPITLTEDILVKLGFEIDSVDRPRLYADYKVINPITKDYMIELKNVGKGWFYRNGYFKIDYVHQLQNLYFALCGEELTFKKW